MKKRILCMLLIAACMICFAACNPAQEEPSKPENVIQWRYSDTAHWHLPQSDGEADAILGVVYGFADHIDEDDDHTCDVCGYGGME